MLTALSFIFVLGVLIFFHELGHFLVAKRVGIRVERFSIGFPPYLFSRRKGDTVYSVGVIPLGGFVKMAGENPDEASSGSADEFMAKSVRQRAAVIFAGPLMNYLLAIFILVAVYLLSGIPYSDPERILIGEVVKGSPAEAAGLKPDDQVVTVNREPVTEFEAMRRLVNAAVEKPVEVTWLRAGDTLTQTIVTRRAEIPNADGGLDTVGEIGVVEKVIGYERYGVLESFKNGFVTTHVILYETVKFVKQLIFGQVSARMLGGPLFIAQQSGKEARRGASRLFFFIALLSVNLAVLNVLPIPVLDGGHLIFLLVEAIKGSPLSMRARVLAQQIGMVAILGLIVFVTYNDVLRLIRGM